MVLIELFARRFGHHTARQNTAQGGKKRTFGWRASGSKRLLSSLLKWWKISTWRTLYLHFSFSHLISETCVKWKAPEFVVSRSRASSFLRGQRRLLWLPHLICVRKNCLRVWKFLPLALNMWLGLFPLQPIAVGGAFNERISCFKLLGVYISKDLSWASHCDSIIKRANRRLYAQSA